ncbi:hypothetical protein JCM10049v2_000254 [Rhodotorula toruloides]
MTDPDPPRPSHPSHSSSLDDSITDSNTPMDTSATLAVPSRGRRGISDRAAEAGEADADTMEVDPPHPLGSLSSSRTNPLTFLASSSPSRALSRMWDRFSPPSVSSPFHLPHPPAFPPNFLARSAPPASPDPTIPAETDLFAPQRQTRPILEQHDSASQLSFSLRRGSEAGVGGRLPMSSVREEEAVPASRWRSASEGWESPFKLPSMPWKGKEKDNSPLESNILGYDDEACFVDGLEGKVDFLASLPSEISLHILTHLDFRDVLSVSLVSRQWRILALDPLLWRDLFHQNPRWHIKPEAYRAAAQAAQAAQAAATAAKEAVTASQNGTGSQQASDRPVMPNLKRAASSFGRAGAKRLVTGADRVSQGGAVIGRKLSEIVGDFGGLSLVPGMASAPSSRGHSRAPSENGDVVMEPSQTRPQTRPSPNRRSTGSTPLLSLSTAGPPSLSTLQTNAFASPPSATLSRNNSSSALSSLTSALPTAMTTPRRNSAAPPSVAPNSPVPTSKPRLPSSPYSNAARPATADFDELTDPAGAASLYLDWPRLYRDRWLLERRWQRGKPSWSWFEGHTDSVYCIQFDERKIISGSRDQTIRVWDIASGTTIHTLTGHEGSVLCLQYDSSILVTGSSDSRVIVWDLVGDEATGKGKYEQKMTLVGHAMGVLDLCFDDKWIVSCSKDTTTRVWNRSTGELYRVLQGHRGPVNAVQLHGDHVLTASGDALMKLWDLHTGQTIRTFSGHSRGLACVHWAPSGSHFVSSSNDKTIKLWNAETGECVRTFVGHTDLVRGLAYDEKSKMIVSGGYDRSTRVWDAETGREIHKFKSHASLVFDVAFDASRIISSSHDKRILLMNFGVGLDVDKFA